TGYFVGTRVGGDASGIADLEQNSRHYYQRPDLHAAALDITRTSLSGVAGGVNLSKIGGQKVRFTSTAHFKSPGFDINDLGFFRRADEIKVYNWIQLRSDVPTKHFRSRMINFNEWAGWNYDRQVRQNSYNINAHATWTNNWNMGTGVTFNRTAFDDRLTRGGPSGLTEGYTVLWSYVNTDERRPVWGNVFVVGGRDGVRSRFRSGDPSIGFRPMSSLTLETGVHLEHNDNDYQWVNKVTDVKDHYVFARLSQTTVSLTGRLNYTMSPTLSLQLYAQPFVSGGAYHGFKELVDGRNPQYDQ